MVPESFAFKKDDCASHLDYLGEHDSYISNDPVITVV